MKKILVVFLFFLASQLLYAQQTQILSNKHHLFEEGKSLFVQKKYGMAKKVFQSYLSEVNENSGFYADASYYIACASYELNDPNSESILKTFVEKYPYYPMQKRIAFMLGRLYFEQKKYKQAINYLGQVDPYDLNQEEAEQYYFAQGFCLLQQKEYQKAKMNFLRISYSDSYFDEKNYYIAYCDYSLGDYTAAQQGFERCKLTKYEEPALYHLLQIHEQMGNSTEAVKVGRELIQKYPNNPNNTEAFRILGESAYKNGNYQNAILYLTEYEKLTQKVQREDMFILGVSYYKQNNYKSAIKYLSKATTQNDEIAENAYYLIGQCALKTNDVQRAKMSFYSAYSIGTDKRNKEEALYNYAIATYQTGSVFGESTKAFNQFLNEYPSSEHADKILDMLASAYMNESNYDEALKAINTIKKPNAKIQQAKEYILFRLGVKYFNEKKYKKAEDALSQSILLKNSQSITQQAYLFRGETYFKTADYDKAISDLKTFVSKNKNNNTADASKAFYTIGYCYFYQSQWANSRQWFTQYLSNEPDKKSDYYYDAQCRIGDCYFYERNFTSAASSYTKVISSNSTNTDYALYQKAFIKGLQKKYREEIADLQSLIKKYPNSVYAPKAQYEIGRAYVLQNKYNDAIGQYNVVLEKYPQNPIARKASLEIGMLYENMGQNDMAIAAYKKVVERYPGSEQTNVALESMQNLYVDKNDVSAYIKYTKSLGLSDGGSASKEDSLSYIAAEKVYAKKDYNQAIPALDSYLSKYCTSSKATTLNCVNATYYLAESYYEKDNTKAALEKYKILALLDGNEYQEESLVKAGEIAFDQKQFDEAAKYFKKLKEVSASPQTRFKSQLGILRCYYRTNNHSQVVANANILLDSPVTPEVEREARYCRMKSLIALGNWTEAIKDVEVLKNDVSNSIGAESAFIMAEYYFYQKQLQQSEDEIVAFIDKKSPFQYWIARSFILLADIYIVKKDDYQAKQYLLTLKENYKANDDIEQMVNSRLADIDTRYKETIY